MKTITRTIYQAIDGREFSSEKKCKKYEAKLIEINTIMETLHKPTRGFDFSNGRGYYQQDKQTVLKAIIDLLKIANRKLKDEDAQSIIDGKLKYNKNFEIYIGRIIDEEFGSSPINSAWFRIMCIDKDYREWGIPYFAANPNKGKDVKLN